MPYKDYAKKLENNRKWYWEHRDQRRAAIRSYEQRNKEKLKEYRKKWVATAGREWSYSREIQSLYNISLVEYNHLLEAQEGLCGICRRAQNWRSRWGSMKRRFCVDHDHKTGKVRGLLCDRCNLGLSKFDDEVGFLRAAVAYLEEHKSEPE